MIDESELALYAVTIITRGTFYALPK